MSRLAGTGTLLRLAVRQDRVLVPVWLVVLVGICYASAAGTLGLYPTAAERVEAATAIDASPGLVALYGPILDLRSVGELAMAKMTVTYALLVMVMMLFVVRRHTRVPEESGQAELLSGTAVGRGAPLAAATAFGAGTAVLLGVLVVLVNTAAGLPLTGSVAFGGAWAGCALVATGLTALAAQLSASARTCAGVAAATIAAMFVLRAVGDTSRWSFLSWLSPFGWNTQLRSYGATRWWVLLLHLGLALLLVVAAGLVHARRDLGAGVLSSRPGPAVASPRLSGTLALVLDQHLPMLAWWSAACLAGGLLFGAVSPSMDGVATGSVRDLLEQLGGSGAFRDVMLGAVISVLALLITCFAVAVIGHGADDEHDGRAEQVLATAASRARLFAAMALVALVGATWLLLVTGLGVAVGAGPDGDSSSGRLVVSALAQAPAVWTVTAVVMLLFALRSRWTAAGWGVVVLFAALGQIGALLRLPGWVLDLSPYSHSPQMPLEDFRRLPALVLTVIAAGLLGAAWARYRVRDVG